MVIVAIAVSFASSLAISSIWAASLFWRSQQHRVVGVCLHVLLQVLRTLESFTAEVAFVRFEWNMDSNVGCDVIALDGGGTA